MICINKFIIGALVLLAGGLIGWYYFRGGAKLPGMKIGTTVTPSPLQGTNGDTTFTEESPVGGTKGGVMTEGTITYTDAGYQPKEVTVKKGTKVTFTNDSAIGMWTASAIHPTHQVLPGFDAKKSVTKGGTYEYTFVKVGTWQYHNHMKPTDIGVIVVTE